jgi:hypothetical protein
LEAIHLSVSADFIGAKLGKSLHRNNDAQRTGSAPLRLKPTHTDFVYLITMKHFFALLTAVTCTMSVAAQSECGTVMPAGYQLTYGQRVQQVQPGVIQGGAVVVPVHIHLIRESNGNSVLTLQDIQNELDSVNYFYENAGLVFIECMAAEMIDDDNIYNYESSNYESYLLTNHFTPNVLNLYFANTVALNSAGVCGYAWFPGGPDAAFIAAGCATNGSTLAHEIGHYMGLMHTHGGSSDELVDGSNCSFEGDWICDTPADPGLSGLVDTACIYTGTALDANNQPYQPDVTNIMSYSRKKCRTTFTPTQYSVINATYWSDRTYLQCSPTGIEAQEPVTSRVFPNPAQDEIRVLFANGAEDDAFISIYDATGRCVQTQNVAAGAQLQIVNVSALPDGIYTCSAGAGTSTFVIAR